MGTSNLVAKKDESERSISVISDNWENDIQALRIYTEKGLECFECERVVEEEIGTHLTLVHLRKSVQDWNKPSRSESGRLICGICGLKPESMDRYLMHSTYAHGALYELNKSREDLNLDGGIQQALKNCDEKEQRNRKLGAKVETKGVKRKRSPSTGRERNKVNENPIVPKQEELRMAQKVKSYKKLTDYEVEVIRREIPLRRSSMVEKEELRIAVKKLLTKLHLVYTIGANEVPQEYTTIRNSINTNVNKLYSKKHSDQTENMWNEK